MIYKVYKIKLKNVPKSKFGNVPKTHKALIQQRFVGFFLFVQYTSFYAMSTKRWYSTIRRFSTAAPTCIKSCIQNSPLQRFLRVSLSQLSARLKKRATSFLRREKAIQIQKIQSRRYPSSRHSFFQMSHANCYMAAAMLTPMIHHLETKETGWCVSAHL